ncbi:hypothetical protein [Luteolibacter luteus]|uniref:PEP-CTERM sorting domain-containing protein n=1 Tax=Luteolibacter luteus TaxID=2728835 RepID=A0A858RCJ3_9BACT|nr:hypothetical protein [Luteolibacter luteus]QJE94371.1 hypothetical protein HHL09_00745 [Luteolibacter luteus]
MKTSSSSSHRHPRCARILALAACGLSSISVSLAAVTVVNPDMDSDGSPSHYPSGWSTASALLNPETNLWFPDGTTLTTGLPQVKSADSYISPVDGTTTIDLVPSSNGGTYAEFTTRRLGDASFPAYWHYGQGMGQTLSGLTVGETYQISFEQTNLSGHQDALSAMLLGDDAPADQFDGRFLLFVNGEYVTASPTMGMLLMDNVWETVTLTFVAPSEEIVLDFYAHSGPDSWGMFDQAGVGEPYANYSLTTLGMDGIAVSPVPEPSGTLLAGIAGILTALRRRRIG